MTAPLKNIMVVEDNEDLQELLSVALTRIGGFNVVVCGSGEECLEKIQDTKEAIQLLLLDVIMPTMDGPATLQQLRAQELTTQPIVIFMTARDSPEEIAAYKKMGAAAVISKPFDPITLPALLNDIWNKSR